MLGKIKKIRADLSENRLSSGLWILLVNGEALQLNETFLLIFDVGN
jgi:hypothetical protein